MPANRQTRGTLGVQKDLSLQRYNSSSLIYLNAPGHWDSVWLRVIGRLQGVGKAHHTNNARSAKTISVLHPPFIHSQMYVRYRKFSNITVSQQLLSRFQSPLWVSNNKNFDIFNIHQINCIYFCNSPESYKRVVYMHQSIRQPIFSGTVQAQSLLPNSNSNISQPYSHYYNNLEYIVFAYRA